LIIKQFKLVDFILTFQIYWIFINILRFQQILKLDRTIPFSKKFQSLSERTSIFHFQVQIYNCLWKIILVLWKSNYKLRSIFLIDKNYIWRLKSLQGFYADKVITWIYYHTVFELGLQVWFFLAKIFSYLRICIFKEVRVIWEYQNWKYFFLTVILYFFYKNWLKFF
jgi:hypothetical protein